MTTSTEEVLSIMGVDNVGATISFIENDLPLNGVRHNRALYITVECLKAKIPRVLVDNGFALNFNTSQGLYRPLGSVFLIPSYFTCVMWSFQVFAILSMNSAR